MSYVEHFCSLSPPLSPNSEEVSLYTKLVGNSKKVLLLGYTKQLLHLATVSVDLNPPPMADEKIRKGDWFDINEYYDVIIGDGVLNLVGGGLVNHLRNLCSKLIIRFFTDKFDGMKYATYFNNNTTMIKPDEEYETQQYCKIFVWNFATSNFRNIKPLEDILDQLESEEYKKTFLQKRNEAMRNIETKPFLTRYDLQNIIIPKGVPISTTSGSTGIPVVVPKTQESILWHKLTNLREMKWRKWNLNNGICVVMLAGIKKDETRQNIHSLKMRSVSEFEKYLIETKPVYLFTYPSIISSLNLSLIPSLIDIKSVGEPGGTNYSCEEAGTIALQCPEYPENGYHIMENIIVENHAEHGAVISDLSNPCITRYIIGDKIELSSENCKCGRLLPVIKKIYGRKRNMLVLPNDKIWPAVGEPLFRTLISNKIKRHRVVQKTLNILEIQIECEDGNFLEEREQEDLCKLVLETLGYKHLTCYVVNKKFENGKFEAFVSEIL